ncbi:MAG TPA: hypothetical protein VGO66_07185 [Solirubrobacterales bacterium]|jgi:hypothetical protein|nr:hypothetical protein [Solirubrobacterales bacterium]
MAPWKLPLVVAAIAVPIIAVFLIGGPGVGAAIGGLAAVGIVFLAASQSPRGAIGQASRRDAAQKLLVVVADPLEDPAAVEQVSRAVTGRGSQVMVLAPARIGFLDRWASDVEAARRDAQRRLVLSIAALAAAGIEAEARVGDEDVVQAVEDQLGRFAATDVILVSVDGADSKTATAAAEELRSRLRTGFRWIVTGSADR